MIIYNAPVFVPLADVSIGNLIVMGQGADRQIGIVIERDGDNQLIGVLDDTSEAKDIGRFRAHMPHDGTCLSFGSDWVLELLTDLNVSDDGVSNDGTLLLTPNGPEFRFRGRGAAAEGRTIHYSLTREAEVPSPRTVTAVGGWRIWASEAAHKADGIEPLVDHT